ncbi:MAG TPA: hypothetical protein VLE02_01860 [Nitrosarchaeum sp.]|nr:hypothetical protein [Nitrosarchaeum sp.]
MKRAASGKTTGLTEFPLPENFGRCVDYKNFTVGLVKDPQGHYNSIFEYIISRDENMRNNYLSFSEQMITPLQHQINIKRKKSGN